MAFEKTTVPPTGLARRLYETRKDASLSIRKAGVMLGTSAQTVFSWERGTHEPSAGALKNICRRYRVSADWLLFGDDAPVYRDFTLDCVEDVRGIAGL
jgi:transcriptional regulator with XRE-family HTH domain